MSKELRDDVTRYKRKSHHSWVLLISIYSILYGIYYINNIDTIHNVVDPVVRLLPIGYIGWMLIAISCIFVGSVFTSSKLCFRIGLVGLSFMWGGLFMTAAWYGLRSGYPSSIWLDKFLVVSICLKLCDFSIEGGL